MLRHARPRTVGTVLGLVLVLLGVAALGARSVPGTGRRAPVRLEIDAGRLLSIGFWMLAVATGLILVWAVWSSGIRVLPRSRPQRRWVRVLWTVAVASAVVWVLVRFRPEIAGLPEPTIAPPPDEVSGPAGRDAVWVLALLLGVAATGILLAVRRPPRAAPAPSSVGPAPGSAPPRGEKLPAVVGHRGAVIGAYAAMEGLFAEQGARRGRAEAPREYLDRATRRFGGARPPAAVLTGLYEVARYSDRAVDEPMETAAGAALDDVQRALEET